MDNTRKRLAAAQEMLLISPQRGADRDDLIIAILDATLPMQAAPVLQPSGCQLSYL